MKKIYGTAQGEFGRKSANQAVQSYGRTLKWLGGADKKIETTIRDTYEAEGYVLGADCPPMTPKIKSLLLKQILKEMKNCKTVTQCKDAVIRILG